MIFTTDLKIRTDKILGRKEADAVREELIRKLHLKTDPSQVEVKILRRSLMPETSRSCSINIISECLFPVR